MKEKIKKKISEFLIKHRKNLSVRSRSLSLVVRNIWEKITGFLNIKKNTYKIIIITSAVVIITGISYGSIEYYKIFKLTKEAQQLIKEEKYNEANEKIEIIKEKWFVEILGIQKEKISNEIKKNKKLEGDKSKYNQGLAELDENNFQEAINILSELSESSFYYQKSQTKIEEAKRKTLEGELSQEQLARQKAESKAKQEEFEKKLKEQQLISKETEEKMMNADNDGDSLTYRREQELGTSDWNTDSDNDGIRDNLDAHPAGGGRNIAQEFEWEYMGTSWTWKYSIQEDWYEYYKNKPRVAHGAVYVTQNDPFIQEIAKTLKSKAEKENYHLSSFIVSFVQGLPYIEDYYTNFDEYPKYPVETFIERNGDCEDTSYLFASLIQAAGLGVVLVQFHDHMGVGIKTVHTQSGYYYPIGNEYYYYYETTAKGWQVGDLPKEYLNEKAQVTVVSNGSINNVYPQYVKPCDPSSDFIGYYYDGKNFYSDSQCNNSVHCLSYKEYYFSINTEKLYWDGSCSQVVVKGCTKSTNYSGYFTNSIDYYSDSSCLSKARICRLSSIYYDRYWDGYDNYWDSSCSQKVVIGCDKSVYYPGLFFNGLNYYYDYQCIQIKKP